MRWVAALLATVVLTLAAGCGSDDGAEPGAPGSATLILDFQPNAAHAGIYSALRRGSYRDRGVELTVREPSESTDAPKLLRAGRAEFAILDIHDLGLARQRGLDVVGIAGIVQRPLAAVLARSERIDRPRDLEGREAGVTGLPSDDAVLDSVVAGDGGDPKRVRRVTINFKTVPALAAGRLDAATGFWNAEGVELRRREVPIREFRVDRYGAPRYPELVLVTSAELIRERPGLVRAVVRGTVAGYRFVAARPGAGLEHLLESVRGLDRASQRAQLEALLPVIAPPGGLDRAALRAWARWDAEHGILRQPPAVKRAFDDRFLPPSARR